MKIFAWPPVRTVLSSWAPHAPVVVSQTLFAQAESISSAGPSRIHASIQVPALDGGRRDGAGMSLSLGRLLDGGMNAVRLKSPPANWHVDCAENRRAGLYSRPLEWVGGDAPLGWVHVGGLWWFNGPAIQGVATTLNGRPAIALSGLPMNGLVCRAYDVLRCYVGHTSVGTARAITTVYATGSTAVVALHEALPSGTISIGDQETAVFRATSIPVSPQPVGANWAFAWEFREILPGEYAGWSEENPWNIAE
jgi:hypothetical protein